MTRCAAGTRRRRERQRRARGRLRRGHAPWGRGVDDLDGGPENDKLDGGDDRDRLDGGLGTDTIDGGVASSNGFFTGDTVVYDRVNPVQVDLHRTDGSQDATGENDKIVRVENAQGGHGDDKLTGNAENNILVGDRADDVLKGEAGRDALHGLENETT